MFKRSRNLEFDHFVCRFAVLVRIRSTVFVFVVALVKKDAGLLGRVELYFNGVWRTVCHDYWEQNAQFVQGDLNVMVICRMIGYT